MKKTFLIIMFSIFITGCVIYNPNKKNSDSNGHLAVRYEGIAFSGFYLPPSASDNIHLPEMMKQNHSGDLPKKTEITNKDSVLDKYNYKIKVLSREFLDPGFTESPVFGYYAYLIFTDQSSSTYTLRKEAAKAFMCQLKETDRSKVIGVNTKNMAVFYAPVQSGTIGEIKTLESGETLLKHYNYNFAKALMDKIDETKSIENFTVGIIAHPVPFSFRDGGPIILDDLEVINLSNIPPFQVGAVIRKLRQAVLAPDQIKEIRIPENIQHDIFLPDPELQSVPVYIDLVIKDFAVLFRTILATIKNLMPQVETAEASSIICK